MNLIRNYIPEIENLRDKHAPSARICREECAVLDPADHYRILAWRGKRLLPGVSLFDQLFVTASDIAFLESAIAKHNRILIGGLPAPILIFADLLKNTGLLIALSPHLPTDDFLQTVSLLEELGVAVAPSLKKKKRPAQLQSANARELLSEWFFFMDRILSPSCEIGIHTRSRLIASFTGCQLEIGNAALPMDGLALSQRNTQRLSAFLFCALLALRHKDGTVHAELQKTQNDSLPLGYRIGVSGGPPISSRMRKKQTAATRAELPFLQLPAFQDLNLCITENGLILEAPLLAEARVPAVLRAADHAADMYLQMEFFYLNEPA